jgi:threonylcarbamoyladenosine tRNA methylthiotransferase MtaB
VESFLSKLDKMRDVLDLPAFATDVIVGFPEESEREFEETLDTCRRAGFMKIHIFPFSPRVGTPAASYPAQIHGTILQERISRLEVLERDLAQRYYMALLGRPLEVMIESQSTREGWVCGTDRRYVPVELPGTIDDIGKMCYGRGTRTTRQFLEAQRETLNHGTSGIQTRFFFNRRSRFDPRRDSEPVNAQ